MTFMKSHAKHLCASQPRKSPLQICNTISRIQIRAIWLRKSITDNVYHSGLTCYLAMTNALMAAKNFEEESEKLLRTSCGFPKTTSIIKTFDYKLRKISCWYQKQQGVMILRQKEVRVIQASLVSRNTLTPKKLGKYYEWVSLREPYYVAFHPSRYRR